MGKRMEGVLSELSDTFPLSWRRVMAKYRHSWLSNLLVHKIDPACMVFLLIVDLC